MKLHDENKVVIALYQDIKGVRFWEQYYGRDGEFMSEVQMHRKEKTVCMGFFEVTERTTFEAPNKLNITHQKEQGE